MVQTVASYQGNSLTNGSLVSGVYSNRMDGVNHDLSGNVRGDPVAGANFYSYDAASRLRTAGGVCYLYSAEGIRTAKGSWSDGQCVNITAQYILGPGGEQVTELDGLATNPVWAHTNVFGAGKLLATYDNVGLHFHFTDWLGTNRTQVNADGTIEETCISLPFGDSLSCSGPGKDATEHHFTGKERDAESGLDYFGARYFQSNAGRWMSPDWAAKAEPIPYAKLDNPQTLNLYAYVENNPLTMADVDGHTIDCGCTEPSAAGQSQSQSNEQKAKDLAAKKETEKAQPAQNEDNVKERATQAAEGALNLKIAQMKFATAVELSETAETGAGAVAVGYLAISGVGSATAGGFQFLGAATGQTHTSEEAAETVGIGTSAFALTTLVATGGNMHKASQAAAVEGIVTSNPTDLVRGGTTSRVAAGADFVHNVATFKSQIKSYVGVGIEIMKSMPRFF